MNTKFKLLIPLTVLILETGSSQDSGYPVSLDKIIEDTMYIEYQKINKQAVENSLAGLYDLKKIDKVFELNDPNSSTCGWNLGEYKADIGTVAYFDVFCKRQNIVQALKFKYPFLVSNDVNLFPELSKLYVEKHGQLIGIEESVKIFSKRNKD